MSVESTAPYTHKHKHYAMFCTRIHVCANGSWKVWLTDKTRPTAKQRRPKNYMLSTFEMDQWESMPQQEKVS